MGPRHRVGVSSLRMHSSDMQEAILSVSEVTAYVKQLLDRDEVLQQMVVRGEISNFTSHRSGHLYFSLKDEGSQLSCVCFRRAAQDLDFAPEEGMQVVAHGNVTVYERAGRYQLIVRFMRPDGAGELAARLEELKARLEAEGLFDPARKRPLPRFPRAVGICTSPTGAAVQDMIRIMTRRYPRAKIVQFPTVVQGEVAAPSIVQSLQAAGRQEELDVIIVGRGGGSLEDLWAFNEEAVARAIFACPIPVISAVGHETDFTIADYVADARAATPSEAAEMVVPDQRELLDNLVVAGKRLRGGVLSRLQRASDRLAAVADRPTMRQPQIMLEPWQQRLDEGIALLSRGLDDLVSEQHRRLEKAGTALTALSPTAVLERGYAICQRGRDGAVVRSVAAVQRSEPVRVTVTDGNIFADVTKVSAN